MMQSIQHHRGPTAPYLETADRLRLTEREQALRGAIVLGGYAIGSLAAFGVLGALGVVGDLAFDPYPATSGWPRLVQLAVWIVAAGVCAGAAWLCYSYAWAVRAQLLTALAAYDTAVADWHEAALAAYQASRGQQQTTTYTRAQLRCDDPNQFIAAAVAYWFGRTNKRAPWALEQQQDGVYLFINGSLLKLGTFTEEQGARHAKALAGVGAIAGRDRRLAGVIPDDLDFEAYMQRVLRAVAREHGRGADGGEA